MGKITLTVQKQFCAECSLALRRFIGNMDGVNSIDVENGRIVVDFDALKIPGETVLERAKDSVEKLGYKLVDEEDERQE
jgi:copper chaperone CopZ